MDAYLTKSKASLAVNKSSSTRKKRPKQRQLEGRPTVASNAAAQATTSTPTAKAGSIQSNALLAGGIKATNAPLLKQLGTDESAITNSTAYSRTLHIQSVASGHQSGGGGPGGSTKWRVHRNTKLKNQAPDAESDLFKGLVFYINGLTGKSITNQQLKRLIYENGGTMKYEYLHILLPSLALTNQIPHPNHTNRLIESAAVTHAFVSNLSGSKLQRVLTKKCNRIKYVTVQWAIESVRCGKRLREADYAAPIFAETQSSVMDYYANEDSRTIILDDDGEIELKRSKETKKSIPRRSLNHPSAFETCHDLPPPSAAPTEALPRLPPPKGLIKEKDRDKVETVVLSSSSPWVIENAQPGRLDLGEESEEEEEDALDEWGMPPSAQKCRR
ncbi:BQ5605_C007g04553 [Microbotryum silenes-dioicae]|uniref:BQ5605_C007g04553 protein n=1 Tax=Microbotryum silenes-dioicae TaxID=796604 RepID=A0A2X0P9G4_9BASI|nr:BQ5605_C007g04553 [Microbotryum silenes-dioicae]